MGYKESSRDNFNRTVALIPHYSVGLHAFVLGRLNSILMIVVNLLCRSDPEIHKVKG